MSTARRSFAVTAVVAALMWAVTAPAFAHVSITPDSAPEGSTQEFILGVGHGCDDSPTIKLSVHVSPDAFDQVAALAVEGWTLTLDDDVITWEADEVPEGGHEEDEEEGHGQGDFGFVARVIAPAGTVVPVPLIQECVEGRYDWIQVPAEGQSHDDLDEPAPLVTVTDGEPVETTTSAPEPTTTATPTTVAETTAPPTTVAPTAAPTTSAPAEDEGGSAAVPILIGAIAVGGIAAGVVWWRRRNNGTASGI